LRNNLRNGKTTIYRDGHHDSNSPAVHVTPPTGEMGGGRAPADQPSPLHSTPVTPAADREAR
jgi:hypothetical protein